MKITEVEAHVVSLPMRIPYTTALAEKKTAPPSSLAFTIAHLKLPGEMNGFLRAQDDVAAVDLRVEGGDLLPPKAPGVGATLDPAKLRRYVLG